MGWIEYKHGMDGDSNHDLAQRLVDDVRYNFLVSWGRMPTESEAVNLTQHIREGLTASPEWLSKALTVLSLAELGESMTEAEKVKLLVAKDGDKKLKKILSKHSKSLGKYERAVRSYWYKRMAA